MKAYYPEISPELVRHRAQLEAWYLFVLGHLELWPILKLDRRGLVYIPNPKFVVSAATTIPLAVAPDIIANAILTETLDIMVFNQWYATVKRLSVTVSRSTETNAKARKAIVDALEDVALKGEQS